MHISRMSATRSERPQTLTSERHGTDDGVASVAFGPAFDESL